MLTWTDVRRRLLCACAVDKLQTRVREKEEAATAAEQALEAATEEGASNAAAAAARIGALEAELAGYQQLEEVIQVRPATRVLCMCLLPDRRTKRLNRQGEVWGISSCRSTMRPALVRRCM